jgi:hypothetical protein
VSVNLIKLSVTMMFLAVPFGAVAEENVKKPTAVVELFTSQGCTSCPRADKMLQELAASGDVVALAYHVDYWDYLGWRDTLANPANTARQQEYSRAFSNRSVYTPQAVVNGRQQMNGAKPAKVEAAISQMAGGAEGMAVDVSISYEDESIIIETGASERPVRDAQIVVVYFRPSTTVDIERGRNNGRVFTYVNAVSGFHSAGMWHGKETRLELPVSELSKKGAGGCAVLIQEMLPDGLPGPILGAAVITQPSSW